MNKQTQSIFAVSIVAIAAVMIFSLADIPQAIADDDHKPKFHGKPDFKIDYAPVDEDNPNTESFDAKGKLWLSKDHKFLKYRIVIDGMDISGFMGPGNPPTDDVTKMHFHADSIFGKHVLNQYKAPSEDDDDLVVKPTKGIVKGIWDDGDETVNPMNPAHGSTLTLSSQLENLCNDNLWAVIHGSAVQVDPSFGDRVLGGQIIKTKHNDVCDDPHDDSYDDS